MSVLRVRYQTIEFSGVDIHLRTLRDNQQFSDPDGVAERLGISSAAWPLFGVLWPSSRVLARFMSSYDIEGKRILEVGCGIALTSLLLNSRAADITATDYHPQANAFLRENTRINQGRDIPFLRTGWDDGETSLGEFDLIIGSDLLYEHEHVDSLSGFIEQHAMAQCDVILVDPGRGNHARFSKRMITLGYSHAQCQPEGSAQMTPPFKGQILQYSR